MFAGLGVGYLFHYGYFKRIELDPTTATRWEQKMPFKKYTEHPSKYSFSLTNYVKISSKPEVKWEEKF